MKTNNCVDSIKCIYEYKS